MFLKIKECTYRYIIHATYIFFFFRFASTVRPIHKLLIANRGEIACRVMKTAKKLGNLVYFFCFTQYAVLCGSVVDPHRLSILIPIHIRILSKNFYTIGKSEFLKILLFTTLAVSHSTFFNLVIAIGVIFFNILNSVLEFDGKSFV